MHSSGFRRRFFFFIVLISIGLFFIGGECVPEHLRDIVEDTIVSGEPGEEIHHTVDGVNFSMRLAPMALIPTGVFDDGSYLVPRPFYIAETPVTYELWQTVRTWAETNGYTFTSKGREGSHGGYGDSPTGSMQEPVTTVHWGDSIVWCNALTEYYNDQHGTYYNPVYRYGKEILRDSTLTTVWYYEVIQENFNGFRLPQTMEWELAARYNSNAEDAILKDGLYWTPGNYASGAMGPAWVGPYEDGTVGDLAATREVAWFFEDYGGNTRKTQDVGQKPSEGNGLGLYDMSGNVREWCYRDVGVGAASVIRGGGFASDTRPLRVGMEWFGDPESRTADLGFRTARYEFAAGVDPTTPTYILRMELSGNGTITPSTGNYAYDEGEVVTITAVPKSGWTFSHWLGDVQEGKSTETSVTMDSNKTVQAVFIELLVDDFVDFSMELAPASTFLLGIDDDKEVTVEYDFYIMTTPVTYQLWYVVRNWAQENGYLFNVEGQEGSEGVSGAEPTIRKEEPVTSITWRDAMVWCNALTEFYNARQGTDYEPVYVYGGYGGIGGTIIRDATRSSSYYPRQEDRNGFRLPLNKEWELAARYRGSDRSQGAIEYPVGSGNYWSPGNYASGATGPTSDEEATQAASWYNIAYGGNTSSTQEVGQKPVGGNGLGLYDMSGNVWEWCFDSRTIDYEQVYKTYQGGSWNDPATWMAVGLKSDNNPDIYPAWVGLRVVQTK